MQELVLVHGELEPLVRVDLTPTVHVRVAVLFGEQRKDLVISVRQRVRHFKKHLERLFSVSAGQMRLWYCDQELAMVTGPEEMKWPEKGLYTLAIRDGDSFVIEQRQAKKQG